MMPRMNPTRLLVAAAMVAPMLLAAAAARVGEEWQSEEIRQALASRRHVHATLAAMNALASVDAAEPGEEAWTVERLPEGMALSKGGFTRYVPSYGSDERALDIRLGDARGPTLTSSGGRDLCHFALSAPSPLTIRTLEVRLTMPATGASTDWYAFDPTWTPASTPCFTIPEGGGVTLTVRIKQDGGRP